MWVLHQDKIGVEEFKNVWINYYNGEYCVEINGYDFGYYSSKEKAIKVLDMIVDCLKDNFERGMYEPCIEFYERGVFKMPKDDEVE